jgi:hypothetical protein
LGAGDKPADKNQKSGATRCEEGESVKADIPALFMQRIRNANAA